MATLGYYIHHQGTGHMQRALQIIPHIPGEVIMFSSAKQPDQLPHNARYVTLTDDAIEGFQQPLDSGFMYTPFNLLILERYKQLLNAIIKYQIKCIYIDVSMEVAMFCRTLGLRVGHNVMQGIRTDTAHNMLYKLCDFYLSDTVPALDETSVRNGPLKVAFVSGISRYKIVAPIKKEQFKNIIITISPKSESLRRADIERTAQAYPDKIWHIVGNTQNILQQDNVIVHGIVPDPIRLYKMADVIVGAGGHNTITETASLGKVFLCIPEPRPYDEQVVVARALAAHNMAFYEAQWPDTAKWATLFATFESVDLQAFQAIVSDTAAEKAANTIAECVESHLL